MRNSRHCLAIGDFNFILGYFPNHPQALLLKDEACKKCGKPATAGTCQMDEVLSRAIAVNPEAAGTYVVQGIFLARDRRYPAAIESYKRALALEPNSPNGHYNLGLAYFETKQYALANQHAQKAYALGFSLPGLREKLKHVGYWKPIAPADTGRTDPPAAGGGEQAAKPAPPAGTPQPGGDNSKEQSR